MYLCSYYIPNVFPEEKVCFFFSINGVAAGLVGQVAIKAKTADRSSEPSAVL
jgi:hypothetical protein